MQVHMGIAYLMKGYRCVSLGQSACSPGNWWGGHSSEMWYIVWICPNSKSIESLRPHECNISAQLLWLHRTRFREVHDFRGWKTLVVLKSVSQQHPKSTTEFATSLQVFIVIEIDIYLQSRRVSVMWVDCPDVCKIL